MARQTRISFLTSKTAVNYRHRLASSQRKLLRAYSMQESPHHRLHATIPEDAPSRS
jgi:hypothetical protein